MKRLLSVAAAFIFVAAAIMFAGCGANNSHVVYPNSMSAVVGNVLSFSASGSDITATRTNGTLTIIAKAASRSTITFTIPSYVATYGDQNITAIGLPVGAVYDSLGNGIPLTAARGLISFDRVSPYLEGSFNFVCSDSTTVTSGVFKIKAP